MSDCQSDDMARGVKNFIEAAGIHEGDKVLFLADTRSDPASLRACTLGLKMIGAKPIVLIMDHLARYSRVPEAYFREIDRPLSGTDAAGMKSLTLSDRTPMESHSAQRS